MTMTPKACLCFIIVTIASSCHKNPSPIQEKPLVKARDRARLIMERHCGNCHIPESHQALPRALAVYNLRQEEWAKNMREDQLKQIPGEDFRRAHF